MVGMKGASYCRVYLMYVLQKFDVNAKSHMGKSAVLNKSSLQLQNLLKTKLHGTMELGKCLHCKQIQTPYFTYKYFEYA